MKRLVSIILMIAVWVACNAPPLPVALPGPDTGQASEKGEPPDYSALTAGAGHSCLSTSTGRVECWGADQFGQLGGGGGPFIPLESAPVVAGQALQDWVKANVRGLSGRATSLEAGYYHTCALVEGGAVQCWGQNDHGQLGDGTTRDRNQAVAVQGLDVPATAIGLGFAHTCALLETGEVRCWGGNEYGQLGNGTGQGSTSPVPVRGLPGPVIQLAVGGAFTCALTEPGQLYCWGNGANGRFGDGSARNPDIYPTPVLVDGLDQAIDLVVAGDHHLCARTVSGEILCWGSLSSDREYTSRTPMVVKELTGKVVRMAAGGGYTCAVTNEAGVKCWGDNYFGQLGDGTNLGSWEPVDVSGRTGDVSMVASGSGHVCAFTMDGGVKCWGDCSFGQCGDSTIRWEWSSYTNRQYHFSMDYPSGWNVKEIPDPADPSGADQVWFASSSFPPPQTDARADIALRIAKEDPISKWDERFFDHYRSESIWLGNVSAVRISGTNKESRQDELVVILQMGDYFIEAMPNQSEESLRYFDQVIHTLRSYAVEQ